MKLSEAIRLGAMLKPQAFGEAFKDGGSCAFGAARDATGIMSGNVIYIWHWLRNPSVCPECGDMLSYTGPVISEHLNDTHKWTRERIAAWVATVEPQEQEESHAPSLVPDHASALQPAR